MLEFRKTDEGFEITERMMSQKRVNNDPWREVTDVDREWFDEYYRGRFEKYNEEKTKWARRLRR